MSYVDLATIQTTDPGDILTAAWCDQTRDNQEFFIDPPACAVYNSTTQALSSSTQTALNANSETFDNDSMHSTSTNTSRITIQTAGRYLLSGTILFQAHASGARSVGFYVNGATSLIATSSLSIGGSLDFGLSGVRVAVLDVGDYVQCRGWQNSGGNLNATLQEFSAFFMTR